MTRLHATVDAIGATAQIKANPSRNKKPPIDWRLYEEHPFCTGSV
ncbi:Transposase [Granulibacter bethesdensis]|uniref:Transposase n=1 Tax=Granulibacter bethesdensis TaxID=364410 RepID=A0AAC9K947_9PROT|nr:hypothetical protein [Granulibacter bethesdensis]APH54221.1 Transposase [Granulibacter bethesdensis]APH61804.1 Transposase [Granulibacter bethesdensis]